MPEQQGVQEIEHAAEVGAPAETVYRIAAEVERWPQIFPPTVHAEYAERRPGEGEEVIRLWALAHGAPRTWTSRRRLDPDALRVEFRQEVPAHPVAAMGGAWVVEPLSEQTSRVRLLHDYRAVGDDPESLRLIESAVDANSRAELAAMAAAAEAGAEADAALLVFEDRVAADGPAERVYAFLNEADRWTERLPHVARLSLTEDVPGLQTLEMDTRDGGGSVHTTESVRVCFPHHRIVYKQLRTPPLITLHTGVWSVAEEAGRTTICSQHTVRIDEKKIPAVLGPAAGLAEAKQAVRSAIGGNSAATMRLAKSFAESGGKG
ncbi:aromatase/cyclase [Nocardiopsis coralliicola]